MDVIEKSKEYQKNNYNKNGMSVIVIIIAYVAVIGTVFETGGFNVTQAQEEEQSPFSPVFPLPTSPSPSPTSPSPSPTSPTTVSPEVKAQMCDPNNPKLEFVNSTESEVCGLPKSIRNDTITTPTPTPTSNPISPISPKPISPISPKPISPISPRSITPSQPLTPDELP
jgi:hypothetical protein